MEGVSAIEYELQTNGKHKKSTAIVLYCLSSSPSTVGSNGASMLHAKKNDSLKVMRSGNGRAVARSHGPGFESQFGVVSLK